MYPVTPMLVELFMRERDEEARRRRFLADLAESAVRRPSLISRFRELVSPKPQPACATCNA